MEERRERLRSEDDEWSALNLRFETEGLHSFLSVEEKLLHVWRWLGDAEHNLKTSRKMLDKQRVQQNQELKEVELFVGKLKEITDERVRRVEEEKQDLELEMEDLKSQSNTEVNLNEVAGMLRQEGLHNIIHCSLSEQVAYLLVERARLMEEIVMEKERHKGLTANLTDNVKLSSPQMHEIMEQLKADYEKQLRHQREYAIRSAEQMRKSNEDELRQLRQDLQDSKKVAEVLSNANVNAQQGPTQNQELRNRISELSERVKKMEKAMRQLENENETLIYKLSEALTECDEKETLLRNIRMTSVASRRNSRIVSPRQVPSRDASEERRRNEATSEEMRKLSGDLERLQKELLQSREKFEMLATKYERRKQQQRKRVDKQKELHQKELNLLKDKMKKLQEEVTITRVTLQSERTHRDKILQNMGELTEENKKLSNRLFDTEVIMKEKSRNLSLLNLRVSYLEKEKVQLTEQTRTPRLSIDSSASIDPKSQSESEVLEKLSHAITSMRSSITPSTSANTPNQGTPASQTPRTTQCNTIVRPHLLRWFSQPETASPPVQQEHQAQRRSTLTNSFGARLETLLHNIDQLRTIVVASAGNLTNS